MQDWKENILHFCRDKAYILLLSLTALCAYGFKVTHYTVGIDDTPYAYYFEEGLVAIVGRWVLFLLNKIVHISEFAPFLTDFAAVLLLMLAVTVWCALFYSVLGKKIPGYGYYFFACVFLSCPLISEVFTYFLHNGIAIGYLCCGVSLCCFREGLIRCRLAGCTDGENGTKGIRRVLPFVWTAVFLWIALGCYESFMVVWLLGICLLLLTQRFAEDGRNVFRTLCAAALVAVAGLLLRSIMIGLVTRFFGLGYLKEAAVQRSVTEMAAWMFEPGAFSEFAMVLKRVFVMYGVFAYAYYPIRIFVVASSVIFCFGLWRTIRQRDIWIFLLTIGSFAVSFLLVIVEGKATLYRSAQFLPVLCGFGALVAVYAAGSLGGRKKVLGSGVLIFLLCAILWNQCTDMNRWFYVDYMKYESAKEVAERIAYELERDFDTSKPVVFTGTYEVPKGIIGDAYVEYGTETFYRMKRITDRIDEHLLEKFYRSYGVWVAQTPALSVIDWGKYAFDDDTELVRFFKMHGHDLTPLLDTSLYETAEQISLELPEYPQKGSIVDAGDYIIVHF